MTTIKIRVGTASSASFVGAQAEAWAQREEVEVPLLTEVPPELQGALAAFRRVKLLAAARTLVAEREKIDG